LVRFFRFLGKVKIFILKLIIIRSLFFLAAGVCIGILIAPDKGSETRKKVTDAVNDIKNKLKKKAEDLYEDEMINQESPRYKS